MSETKLSVFQVLRTVRDARSTRGAARQVLFALAMRCKPDEGCVCWPSYSVLALDCQLDEATVKRAVKKLRAAKLISVVYRKRKSNRFYINLSLLIDQANAVKAAEEALRLAEDAECANPFATVTSLPVAASTERSGSVLGAGVR